MSPSATFGPQFFFPENCGTSARGVQIPTVRRGTNSFKCQKPQGWLSVFKGLPGLPSWVVFFGGVYLKKKE